MDVQRHFKDDNDIMQKKRTVKTSRKMRSVWNDKDIFSELHLCFGKINRGNAGVKDEKTEELRK